MTVLSKGQRGQRLCRGCRRYMGGGWKNVPDAPPNHDSTASLCGRCYEAWECADSERGRELILQGALEVLDP